MQLSRVGNKILSIVVYSKDAISRHAVLRLFVIGR